MARPPTDPKRPWLDWKRDEPVPTHLQANEETPIQLWIAILLLWFFCIIGGHRLYIRDFWGALFWGIAFWLGVPAMMIFLVTLYSDPEAAVKAFYFIFYGVFGLLFIRDYGVLESKVGQYNQRNSTQEKDSPKRKSLFLATALLVFLPMSGLHRYYIDSADVGKKWFIMATLLACIMAGLIFLLNITDTTIQIVMGVLWMLVVAIDFLNVRKILQKNDRELDNT